MPFAYCVRPWRLIILDASAEFFMFPSSSSTTGTSEQLSVPRSVRVFRPFVA